MIDYLTSISTDYCRINKMVRIENDDMFLIDIDLSEFIDSDDWMQKKLMFLL